MEYVVITLCDITRKSEPICVGCFGVGGGGSNGLHWSVGVRKWGIPRRNDPTARKIPDRLDHALLMTDWRETVYKGGVRLMYCPSH
jgi:hypothetical protein